MKDPFALLANYVLWVRGDRCLANPEKHVNEILDAIEKRCRDAEQRGRAEGRAAVFDALRRMLEEGYKS